MFGSRRLAKRSIVGTQVCAVWPEDGRYYPGVIKSTTEWPDGQEVYNVRFDQHRSTKTFQERELIGPGFQTINIAHLRPGQKVFITHNSRESSGTVLGHDRESDDVRIEVQLGMGDGVVLTTKLEDIRLVESRRSARLTDHKNTNYSQMADLHQETKKRPVSHSIDVPSGKHRQRHASTSSVPSSCDIGEDLVDTMDTDDEEGDSEGRNQTEVMDETTAALVLTSLSCSPLSSGITQKFKEKECSHQQPSPVEVSSPGSSGVWCVSNTNTPSPPHQYLSSSAPPIDTLFGCPAVDEGIDVDDTGAYFAEDTGSRKRRLSTRTAFQCTWPSCGKVYNTCNGIEKHVRYSHLGPKPSSKQSSSDSEEASDHEEEFYYTEVEVSVDTVIQTFADMHTSSPPENTASAAVLFNTGGIDGGGVAPIAHNSLPDHDYQKKSQPLRIPRADGTTYEKGGSLPVNLTTSSNKFPRNLSWQNTPSKISRLSYSRAYSHGTPPKSSPVHRKSRSDTKKCRKYYGMENRDLWCTQCKWKKACSRFLD